MNKQNVFQCVAFPYVLTSEMLYIMRLTLTPRIFHSISSHSVAFSNRRNINLLSVSQTATRELSTYFVLIPVSCAGGIIAGKISAF